MQYVVKGIVFDDENKAREYEEKLKKEDKEREKKASEKEERLKELKELETEYVKKATEFYKDYGYYKMNLKGMPIFEMFFNGFDFIR